MVADSRSLRYGRHLEILGCYNPIPVQDGGKRMGINFDRVNCEVLMILSPLPRPKTISLLLDFQAPMDVGAQPSEPVQHLLFRAGLLPPPSMLAMGRKGEPRDMHPIDPLPGRVMTEANKTIGLQKWKLTRMRLQLLNLSAPR